MPKISSEETYELDEQHRVREVERRILLPVEMSSDGYASYRINLAVTSSITSPGRFYISMLAKMIMAHLLLHYDFRLADQDAPSTLSWRENLLPHATLRILLRKRSL